MSSQLSSVTLLPSAIDDELCPHPGLNCNPQHSTQHIIRHHHSTATTASSLTHRYAGLSQGIGIGGKISSDQTHSTYIQYLIEQCYP